MEDLLRWFASAARDLPWRQTLDPYGIWISEIMLQQTQVKTVIPYWNRWMKEFPDAETLAHASESTVLKLWEGLGYYSRARNLQKAARIVLSRHAGRFPESAKALLDLPGIGPYTAGAIASIAFNQPEPILDGNIIRVLTRLYALRGDPREPRLNSRLWNLAREWVSESSTRPTRPIPHLVLSGNCSALNQALMELGATHCSPKSPACAACPIQAHCKASKAGIAETFPKAALRPAVTRVRRVAVILQNRGHFLIRKRPAGSVNAGFWEFPELDLPGNDASRETVDHASMWTGISPERFSPLTTVNHSITRYRIRLEAVQARVLERRILLGGIAIESPVWRTVRELQELPLTAAHRRLLRQLSTLKPATAPR